MVLATPPRTASDPIAAWMAVSTSPPPDDRRHDIAELPPRPLDGCEEPEPDQGRQSQQSVAHSEDVETPGDDLDEPVDGSEQQIVLQLASLPEDRSDVGSWHGARSAVDEAKSDTGQGHHGQWRHEKERTCREGKTRKPVTADLPVLPLVP